MTKTVTRARRVGGSVVVRLPREVVEKEGIGDWELIEPSQEGGQELVQAGAQAHANAARRRGQHEGADAEVAGKARLRGRPPTKET